MNMTIQYIMGIVFLGAGLLYGLYMARSIWKDRAWFAAAPGKFSIILAAETVIYVLCTVGVSDFLLNTILCRRMKLAGPEALPDCNITASLVPSGIIAFLYLSHAEEADSKLFLVSYICMAAGALLGSRLVGHLKGERILKLMIIFLCVTLLSLIVKMIMSAGAVPTATSLKGWKLAAYGAVIFCAGIFNMLGIPGKPFSATAALLLGLSPLTTLALTLGVLPTGCMAGGINVVPRRKYNPKLILASMTGGGLASIAGTMLAISIDPFVLNVILLIVIAAAIASLIRD